MISIRLSSSESSLRLHMAPEKKHKTSNNDGEKAGPSTEAVRAPYPDWRDKFRYVRDMHLHAMEQELLTDVNFIVGEEKTRFSGHRMILALGSPVFQAMFFGGLAERAHESLQDSISIPDVDPKGFENLLRFLYCGEVVINNDVIAFKTFFAADKYCVISLKNRCQNYLTKCKLRAHNVWVFLESSLFLNCEIIIDRCLSFLRFSTKEALEDNSFLDVNTKTVETFLSLDSLNVSEIRLLLYLVHWAENKSQSEEDTDESFHNALRPLLKLVRFYNLSSQDFVLFLEMPNLKGILDDGDALAILKYILKPSMCSLPAWCCKKVRHATTYTSEHSDSSMHDNFIAISSTPRSVSSPFHNCNKRKWESRPCSPTGPSYAPTEPINSPGGSSLSLTSLNRNSATSWVPSQISEHSECSLTGFPDFSSISSKSSFSPSPLPYHDVSDLESLSSTEINLAID